MPLAEVAGTRLTISCLVFAMHSPQPLSWNYEVASAFWEPLEHLRNPVNRIEHETVYRARPYPAVRLGNGKVLWGLTYRFVQNLLEVIP